MLHTSSRVVCSVLLTTRCVSAGSRDAKAAVCALLACALLGFGAPAQAQVAPAPEVKPAEPASSGPSPAAPAPSPTGTAAQPPPPVSPQAAPLPAEDQTGAPPPAAAPAVAPTPASAPPATNPGAAPPQPSAPPATSLPAEPVTTAPPAPSVEVAVPGAEHEVVLFPELTLAFGLASGIFIDTSAQDDYIEDWEQAQGDIVVSLDGDSTLVSHYLPMLAVSYAPIEYLRLRGQFELGWAPKYVNIANADDRYFSYHRYSAGGLIGLEWPLRGKRLAALGLAAGAEQHWVHFEEHSGSVLGFEVQLSMALRASDCVFGELFVAYDHVPAKSDVDGEFELDYSSLQFGALVHFGLIPR